MLLNFKCQAPLNPLPAWNFYTREMTIGTRLLQLRKANKLSGDRMGELCGVGKSAVAQWESDSTLPTTDKLIELRKHLNFSFDWLLTGTRYGEEDTNGAGHAVQEFAWVYAHATENGRSLLIGTMEAVRKAYIQAGTSSQLPDKR